MDIGFLFLRRATKETRVRVVISAVAVGFGVVLVLMLLSGLSALQHRNERTAWRKSYFDSTSLQPVKNIDPLLWTVGESDNLNIYGDKSIVVITLAKTGNKSPKIPHLSRIPNVNQYYVSPALKKLIDTVPKEQLGNRFQGKLVGVLPNELVSSPDELAIVRGDSRQAQLADSSPDALPKKVYKISSDASDSFGIFTKAILVIGAFGIFFPILMFLSVATRVGSVQRSKQFSALRLMGATRRNITRISVVETVVASLLGLAAAVPVYLLVRPLPSNITIFGSTFFASDFSITPLIFVLVVFAVIGLASLSNWWGMRRVRLSPLGVSRNSSAKQPSARRTIPLLVGLAMSSAVFVLDENWVAQNPVIFSLIIIGGFMLTSIGLISAGPWLIKIVATLYGRVANSAEGLIAARRLQGLSSSIFRSVSGVILVLFMGSFYLASINAVDSLVGLDSKPAQLLHDDVVFVWPRDNATFSNQALTSLTSQLRQDDAFSSIITMKSSTLSPNVLFLKCSDVVQVSDQQCKNKSANSLLQVRQNDIVGRAAMRPIDDGAISQNAAQNLPTGGLLVVAQDPSKAIEKIRTVSAQAATPANVTSLSNIKRLRNSSIYGDFAGLAYAGIAVSVLISSASLAVSTVAGLLERKRTFYLLRLSGMSLGSLKKIVLLESSTALLGVSLVSASLGLLLAKFDMQALTSSVRAAAPSPIYYLVVVGAIVFAVIVVVSILPIISKLTAADQNRQE